MENDGLIPKHGGYENTKTWQLADLICDVTVRYCDKSVSVRVSPEAFVSVCAANGALSLLNLCIYLIGRQMDAQADAFEKEGGFTERLYRRRTERRRQGNRRCGNEHSSLNTRAMSIE